LGPAVGDPEPPVLPLSAQHTRELAGILRRLGYKIRAK